MGSPGERGPQIHRLDPMNGLTRPKEGRVIAGVCAGIADQWGWQRSTVRLIAVLSFLLPGPQILIYLLLWLLMPEGD